MLSSVLFTVCRCGRLPRACNTQPYTRALSPFNTLLYTYVYVCIYIYMYMCVYIYIYIHTHHRYNICYNVSLSLSIYLYLSLSIYLSLSLSIYIYIYIHISRRNRSLAPLVPASTSRPGGLGGTAAHKASDLYVYVYIYMCTCVYVYIYIYIHTYTYTYAYLYMWPLSFNPGQKVTTSSCRAICFAPAARNFYSRSLSLPKRVHYVTMFPDTRRSSIHRFTS